MNKLVNASAWIIDNTDEVLLIYSPNKKLLLMAAILMTIGKLLIIITANSLISIVTIPLFIYWIYYYWMFGILWRRFNYSVVYLVVLPIIMIINAFCIRLFLYNVGG